MKTFNIFIFESNKNIPDNEIFDEYNDDKNSYVMGDPTDGIFVTFSKKQN